MKIVIRSSTIDVMKLLVGLGNPGEKYEHTRHNLGFQVVEKFLKDVSSAAQGQWESSEKVKSEISVVTIKHEKVILAKPKTYMNNSGMAVVHLSSFYKVEPQDIWIVYDELDLPVGVLKIRFGGAAAGHHGVESIIEKLGTDQFWRFRLGIGVSHPHTGQEARDDGKEHTISKQTLKNVDGHVLGKFTTGEQGKVRELIKHGSQALQMALEVGMEQAQNRFNTK